MKDIRLYKRIILLSLSLALFWGCSQSPEKKIEKHMKKGDEYLKASSFKEASIEFKNAVQIDKKNAMGHYNLGLAYLGMGGVAGLQNAFREFAIATDLKPDLLDAQLKMGELYVLSRDFGNAREKAEGILAKDPGNIDAKVLLAASLAGQKNFSRALQVIDEASKAGPENLKVHMATAGIHLARGDLKSAEERLRRAIELKPGSIDARIQLSNLYAAQGRVSDAEGELRKASEAQPKSPAPLIALANLYMRTKRAGLAEKTLKDVVELNPGRAEPYMMLANFHLAGGRPEEAIKVYKAGIEKVTEGGTLNKPLAELLLDTNNVKEASEQVDSILGKNQNDPHGLFLRGRLRLREKKAQEAVEDFKLFLKAEPASPSGHYYLGLAYEITGNPESAKSEFSEATKLAPGFDGARLALAAHLMASGDLKLAMEEATKVLGKNRQNPAANLLAGDISLRLRKPQEARAFFENLVRTAPKDPRGHSRLALAYQMQGDWKRAVAEFEKSLSIEPGQPDVLGMIVSLEISRKEDKKAKGRVVDYMSKYPDNPAYPLLLGRIHMLKRELGEAEAAFKKALEIKDDIPQAYLDLGNLYYGKGSFEEAIRRYNEAIQKDPRQAAPHMMLGVLYEKQGNVKEAEAHYKRLLEISPRFAPALNNLAWLYCENNGNLDVALNLAETAKGQRPEDPYVSDTLGWIYYKKKAYLKAVTLLRESLEKAPDNPQIRYHLGMAYLGKGDKRLARQELSRSLEHNAKYPGADEARAALKDMK